MYNIAIIGAGQLGSRHLQGLKTASTPLFITVMDNSEESLKISRERYDSVEAIGEKQVAFISSFEEMPKLLDLVIIATGSKPRASIVKTLLSRSAVKYIILEKVLFTRLTEYDEIGELLMSRNVSAWVNCPRRLLGAYSRIKNDLNYSETIKMEYRGKDWGLCCNSMHFIDVFMFLTQEEHYTINVDGIEPVLYESKRPGYIEMKGSVRITTDRGNELLLSSLSSSDVQGHVDLLNGKNHYTLDEINGSLIINEKEIKVETPYQSQMTGFLADSILRTGFCALSTYESSANYHKEFIARMLAKYNEITGGLSDNLPIT